MENCVQQEVSLKRAPRAITSLLLVLLLVLSSGPAYAQWVLVGESSSGATVYVDTDTIRRNGDRVTMWELLDYKTMITFGGKSFLSIKELSEYDCAGERHRVNSLVEYSGNMGKSTVVYSDSDEGTWIPLVPRSVDQTLWEFACGKK